ncbi:imelysin family protein [Roseomonas sp. AR75]|uniref:imelysin family protein n=1 Tax=Roseomonas sp. AR75 TaxID=2562311 RepID=UPI0010C0C846|nr:imelysin family protein [Roseomonas sp. AR75]
MPGRRALLAALLSAPFGAEAQTASEAQRTAIRRAVAEHILPRHRAFAAAAQRFEQATAALDAGPDATKAEAARTAWIEAALAFQGVRSLRFGPMDAFDRGYRLAFFPDPRNVIGREMADLLRSDDPAALSPEAFARGRVGAQGLPAAERLLFGNDAQRLLASDGAARRRLLAAIGRNVGSIGVDLLDAWTQADPPYGRVLEGMQGGVFRDPQDGLVVLLKSLHGGLEFLAERQVARPLGASLREAAPPRAEAWRSGQSLAMVQAELAALAELWRSAFAPMLPPRAAALAREVATGFATAGSAAARIAPSLEVAVTQPQGRAAVEDLLRALGTLRRLLTERVAPALDLPVGFNSMDGD